MYHFNHSWTRYSILVTKKLKCPILRSFSPLCLVPGRHHQEVENTVDPEGRSMCVLWFPGSVTRQLRSLWTQKEVSSLYPDLPKLLKKLCGAWRVHKCTLVPRKSQQESEINVIPSHVYPGTQRPCQELKSLCGLGEFHKCTLVPKKHNQEAEITMWIPGSPTCVPWCLRRHC